MEVVLQDELSQVIPAGSAMPIRSNKNTGEHVATIVEQVLVDYLREHVDSHLSGVDHFAPLDRCGVDSVGVVEISVELEKQFQIPLSPEVLAKYCSVNSLATYIEQVGATASTQGSVPLTREEQYQYFRVRNERANGYRSRGQYYFETEIEAQDAAWVQVNGRRLLMMSSYSYLGLIGHAEIVAASNDACSLYGTGVHGVRLLAGTNCLHTRLEQTLATFMRAQAAIVFSSGFLTNVATIGALVNQDDVILGDEWIHASLVDG